MGQVMALYREQIRPKRENSFGVEKALADWCQRRWPDKTIQHVAHHFGLSERIASSVVYANASKNTLRELLHHPKGGPKLFVELVFEATNYSLEQYITDQAHEAEVERSKWQAEERRLALLKARLAGRDRLDGQTDQPPRARGPSDARLGPGPDEPAVELRSFSTPKPNGGRK